MQSKNWCWTSWREESPREWILKDENSQVKYCCAQREICPNTGKVHWQGYAEFRSNQRPSGVIRNLGGKKDYKGEDGKLSFGIFCQMRNGTAAQARDYTRKEKPGFLPNTWWEIGDWRNNSPGKRNDIHDSTKRAMELGTFKKCAEEMPAFTVRFSTGLLRTLNARMPARDSSSPCKIIIIWGVGSGDRKSLWAHDTYPDAFVHPDSAWWDGYEGQDVVW